MQLRQLWIMRVRDRRLVHRRLDLLALDHRHTKALQKARRTRIEPPRTAAEDQALPECSLGFREPLRGRRTATADVEFLSRNDVEGGGADAPALAQGSDTVGPACNRIVVGFGHLKSGLLA